MRSFQAVAAAHTRERGQQTVGSLSGIGFEQEDRFGLRHEDLVAAKPDLVGVEGRSLPE